MIRFIKNVTLLGIGAIIGGSIVLNVSLVMLTKATIEADKSKNKSPHDEWKYSYLKKGEEAI